MSDTCASCSYVAVIITVMKTNNFFLLFRFIGSPESSSAVKGATS